MTQPTDTRPPTSTIVVHKGAQITLFGHPPSPVRLELRDRSRGWRLRRALAPAAAGLVVAPVVAIVPPHAPWVVAVLAAAGTLAWRRWREEYTIVGFEARCPRCDAELQMSSGTRLRSPHPLTCDSCRHEPVLQVDRTTLPQT